MTANIWKVTLLHRVENVKRSLLSLSLQKAFAALCHSTHLYGRRLVLEWADTEESVETLRRKTAEHFHGESTVRCLQWFVKMCNKLTRLVYLNQLHSRVCEEAAKGRSSGGNHGNDGDWWCWAKLIFFFYLNQHELQRSAPFHFHFSRQNKKD